MRRVTQAVNESPPRFRDRAICEDLGAGRGTTPPAHGSEFFSPAPVSATVGLIDEVRVFRCVPCC